MLSRRAACLVLKPPPRIPVRSILTASTSGKPVVVVGVEQVGDEQSFELTPSAHRIDSLTGGRLASSLAASGARLEAGKSRLLGQLHEDIGPVVVVGLGKKEGREFDSEEGVDWGREAIRKAAASGVRAASELKAEEVHIETFGDGEASAEGATLANWKYDQFKSDKKPLPKVGCLVRGGEEGEGDGEGWNRGEILGNSQNLARRLMEAPASFLTPTQFCEEARQALAGLPVQVEVRDRSWAEEKGMGSFLSVAQGSAQPPKFLELHYKGGEEGASPAVFVGKGVTFDTGGISIKPSAKMDLMRGDMGGAAVVTSCMTAVAKLGMNLNLTVLVPLTENMPGSRATRPGDVVTAMNGKTIQVDNTDAEGRLILADALCYADTLSPRLVLDIATLTGACSVALGTAATGVFCTDSQDFAALERCGSMSGDRMWRLPLWRHYTDKVKKTPLADLNNAPVGGGGACTAAAFLREFTTCKNYLHLDMAGVMDNAGDISYLGNGMSGRPTRTLVHYLAYLSSSST